MPGSKGFRGRRPGASRGRAVGRDQWAKWSASDTGRSRNAELEEMEMWAQGDLKEKHSRQKSEATAHADAF